MSSSTVVTVPSGASPCLQPASPSPSTALDDTTQALPPIPEADDRALYEREPAIFEQMMHSFRLLATGYRIILHARLRWWRWSVRHKLRFGQALVAQAKNELLALGVTEFCLNLRSEVPPPGLQELRRMRAAFDDRIRELEGKDG